MTEHVARQRRAIRRPPHRGGAPTERVARQRRAIRRPFHKGGAPTEHVARQKRAMRRPPHRGGAPTEHVARGRRAYKKRTPPRHISQRTLHDLQSCNVLNEMRQRPTLPYSVPYSTIGSMWLNFRVRYENGWIPHDIITAMVYHLAATRGSTNIAFYTLAYQSEH